MEKCRKKHQFIANLPSEARTIFTPGLAWLLAGLRTCRHGRSNDRCFYWPIFPVSEKTSAIGAFDPAYRCGAVPDSHRVPFRRSPRNATSNRCTR